MESSELRDAGYSNSRSTHVWNLIAVISIMATLWAFYYYQPSYTDAVNGAASLRDNIIMSFFLLLLPILSLTGVRMKWMAIVLQIIPILLFLLYSVAGAPVAYWPASLINYLLVYRFFQKVKVQ